MSHTHTPAKFPEDTFVVGQKVIAQQRDSDVWRNALIQEMKILEGVTQYYVHWTDLNRRLDEWVEPHRLRTVQAVAKKRPSVAVDTSLFLTPQMSTRRSTAANLRPEGEAKRTKQSVENRSIPSAADIVRFDDRPKNVSLVHIGGWSLEPWYYTPYPRLVANCVDVKGDNVPGGDLDPIPQWGSKFLGLTLPEIFICEFCMQMFISTQELDMYHAPRCLRRCPPGTEIYRDVTQNLLLFEVDGIVQRGYCERLSLMSRLFLEHKSVDYDMTPFLFYILTYYDEGGCHPVGYFAKEKNSPDDYNLSCILVLPQHQCKGYGRLLIEVSYALSKRLGKYGTPERPLSDLGARTYHSFWRDILLDILLLHAALDSFEVSLQMLVQNTGMCVKDIVDTLRACQIMDRHGSPKLYITAEVKRDHFRRKACRRLKEKEHAIFDPYLLRWEVHQYEMRKVNDAEFLHMKGNVGNTESGTSFACLLTKKKD